MGTCEASGEPEDSSQALGQPLLEASDPGRPRAPSSRTEKLPWGRDPKASSRAPWEPAGSVPVTPLSSSGGVGENRRRLEDASLSPRIWS